MSDKITYQRTGALPGTEDVVIPCHACQQELYDSVVEFVGHPYGACLHCGACVSLGCPEHGPALRALAAEAGGHL
jgi:hypothetical protein